MNYFKNHYKQFILVIFVGFCVYLYSKNKIINQNSINDYASIKKYYQIFDLYGTNKNISISELFSEVNSLNRLEEFNFDMHKSFKGVFLEFKDNPIEVLGHFNKEKFLVNGGEKNLNQKVYVNSKEHLVTPINAIHLSEETFSNLNLSLYTGNEFERDDFNYNNGFVNILLGHNFIKSYDLGDEIKFIFAKKTWVGKVTGFLKPVSNVDFDYNVYNLDNYIILPFASSINKDEVENIYDEVFGEDNDFLKFYYLFKNSGIFYIENSSDYMFYNDSIKEKSAKYNLSFELLRGY